MYLARLDFLRRQGDTERLRSTFQEASKRLQAAFPEAVDRTYRQVPGQPSCPAAWCHTCLLSCESLLQEPVSGVGARLTYTPPLGRVSRS